MLNVWARREWNGLVWLLVGTTGEQLSSINYVESLWRTAICVVVWLVVFEGLLCELTSESCIFSATTSRQLVKSSWNVMAHGYAREGKWSWNITNAVVCLYSSHYLGTCYIQHYYRWCAQLSCHQSTELKPNGRIKWTIPFRRKMK